MCGISGIYSWSRAASQSDRDALAAAHERLRTRGPDAEDVWTSPDGRYAFAHRRLAIIDLSDEARQPMHDSSGELTIVFNGEIYNYRELRKELTAAGATFRTASDTEVILEAYRRWGGEAMLPRMRGMFAFAISDARDGTLFLARDAYGIKPLYYADRAGSFRFASQLRALTADGESREIDPAAACGYFLFGSVPEPLTMFRGIRMLPAGHWLRVDENGAGDPVLWFRAADPWIEAEEELRTWSESEAIGLLADALRESVRYHLVADVPVSAFLSAGIDSGAIAGFGAAHSGATLRAVTVRFPEFEGTRHDEGPFAAAVAAHYGLVHETLEVSASEFATDIDSFFRFMDQPTIDGVNTWFVSKAAAAGGIKVALSGLGGDESFGSYPSFRFIPRTVRLMAVPSRVPGLGRSFRQAFAGRNYGTWPKRASIVELGGTWSGAYLLKRGLFMPWELEDLLGPDVAREGLEQLDVMSVIDSAHAGTRTGFARVASMETALYMKNQLLRDTDWASMAHSLEVRVPMVDAFFVRRISAIALAGGSRSKRLLAYGPKPPLPEGVRSRKKTGFRVPVERWLESYDQAAASPLSAHGGAVQEASSRRWARFVWRRWVAELRASDPTALAVPGETA